MPSHSLCTSTRSLPVERPLRVRSGGGNWSSGQSSIVASLNDTALADVVRAGVAVVVSGAGTEAVGAELSPTLPPQPTIPAQITRPATPQHFLSAPMLG